MIAPNPIAECKFCSLVSKSNGEDPIGSANPTHGWLAMELPQPWTEERFHHDPLLKPVHDLFHEAFDRGLRVFPLAIAPDRQYSVPDQAHVFYYRRPRDRFAQFEKQTFLLPTEQIVPLAKALLFEPDDLHPFLDYQQPADSTRNIMVCTHGNIDVACARFGQPIYSQLRKEYASDQLRVWRCSHFGGHQFAPTLVDFPTGQVWGHLEPEVLDYLVKREGSVMELYQFYRGWSGLTKFEQILEREIWMQQGWNWLNYSKSAQVLEKDTTNEDWAEIRLEFTAPNGSMGAYEGRVEVCGSVMTAQNSGEKPVSVKQYRVSRLNQVA
ncbi:sucrase ferredoxin [Lusitaniella coriacea LEGE 07157]|uniref:Sucrase ferredoxin n=1 Tax=Lusitaniella coriacea LEGE 07157 TaxID=945747 RepID=A0A8J7E3E8_9CYAN|nr:sucrase ferredoxin [Lusitaniella coriacea]MBE9118004.1 sucrase ferredoxin [Lusitaniella coriacea LEGE 07157]